MRTAVVTRPTLAAATAIVVMTGAYAAERLSQHMMSAVALVGAWLMLAFALSYLVLRFRPAVGAPVLVGFGVGAALVAAIGGATMMMS